MTNPGDYQAELRKQAAIEGSALAGGCFLVLLSLAAFVTVVYIIAQALTS